MNFRYYKSEKLIAFVIALSIVCSYISIKIEEALKDWKVISQASTWIDIFSTLTLVLVTFVLVNKVGWKYKIFRWLVDLPNLNGRYVGLIKSSYIGVNGLPEQKECVLEIKQTASSVHIFAYFGDIGTHERSSRSYSVSEQIVKENNDLFLLYYIFTNESEVLKKQLSSHLGTASLNYYPDTKSLDGHYYNQRQNVGTIEVTFVQKELLGRLVP
jgi:hypothetical protein